MGVRTHQRARAAKRKFSTLGVIKSKSSPKRQSSLGNFWESPNTIGRCVRVFWPLENKWFRGKITEYDQDKKVHCIAYDDGDVYFHDLSKSRVELLRTSISSMHTGRKHNTIASRSRPKRRTQKSCASTSRPAFARDAKVKDSSSKPTAIREQRKRTTRVSRQAQADSDLLAAVDNHPSPQHSLRSQRSCKSKHKRSRTTLSVQDDKDTVKKVSLSDSSPAASATMWEFSELVDDVVFEQAKLPQRLKRQIRSFGDTRSSSSRNHKIKSTRTTESRLPQVQQQCSPKPVNVAESCALPQRETFKPVNGSSTINSSFRKQEQRPLNDISKTSELPTRLFKASRRSSADQSVKDVAVKHNKCLDDTRAQGVSAPCTVPEVIDTAIHSRFKDGIDRQNLVIKFECGSVVAPATDSGVLQEATTEPTPSGRATLHHHADVSTRAVLSTDIQTNDCTTADHSSHTKPGIFSTVPTDCKLREQGLVSHAEVASCTSPNDMLEAPAPVSISPHTSHSPPHSTVQAILPKQYCGAVEVQRPSFAPVPGLQYAKTNRVGKVAQTCGKVRTQRATTPARLTSFTPSLGTGHPVVPMYASDSYYWYCHLASTVQHGHAKPWLSREISNENTCAADVRKGALVGQWNSTYLTPPLLPAASLQNAVRTSAQNLRNQHLPVIGSANSIQKFSPGCPTAVPRMHVPSTTACHDQAQQQRELRIGNSILTLLSPNDVPPRSSNNISTLPEMGTAILGLVRQTT
eukprot:m.949525 g.949525  ORF g.949525 m.949525 type:complete len:747 (+) comp23854_c0_seq5:570-2810(+)